MDTRNMRANLQQLVKARKTHHPHQILGVPADATTEEMDRSYHLLLAMCSDVPDLKDLLQTAYHAMNDHAYDQDGHCEPYQPFASKTQYWFWLVLSRNHEIQEITWPVPHNLKPHVDQGAKNNGAWATCTWLTRTPVDMDQEEEQVPAFALHGNLFDAIPLATELRAVGATQHDGTWHVPFFHPTKPKDPSKQWNAVLTWFYMNLPKVLNPDAVRSKSRPSVNNNTVVWRNGTKMKPSAFATSWNAVENQPQAAPRKRRRDQEEEDEDEEDDADGHAAAMSRKIAIKAPRKRPPRKRPPRRDQDQGYRGKSEAAMQRLHNQHQEEKEDEEEEEEEEEEDEEEEEVYNHSGCSKTPNVYMAKRVVVPPHSTHTHDAWHISESEQDESDSDQDSESDQADADAKTILLQQMVEHKVRMHGENALAVPHILHAHTKVRHGGFSTHAQWITHILHTTLKHYKGVLTLDNCADPHIHTQVSKALNLTLDNDNKALLFTTQILQLHQHVFQ